MENNENQYCDCNVKKQELKKFLCIAFMTFLGSFLASYFLMHQMMIHSFHHMKHNMMKHERMFPHDIENDFKNNMHKLKDFDNNEFRGFKKRISAIQTAKYDDAYIIIVDLRNFNNDEKNIQFNVSGNTVSISGNSVKTKQNNESSYYFSETFEIPEKININKIKKERVGHDYIITMPVN